MKKLLVLLMAFSMLFTFAACGGDDTSSTTKSETATGTSSTADSKATSSEASKAVSDDSKADSEAATSDTSSTETSGTETSEPDTSDPSELKIPDFTNKFLSFAETLSPALRATDATSVRFTAVNEAPKYGSVVLFTKAYGASIAAGSETYEDYAILVCTYDQSKFGYSKTSLKQVGKDASKATTKIPADGFVVAIHKEQKTEISHLSNIKDKSFYFVHGVAIGNTAVTAKKVTKAPVLDGKISTTEYGQPVYKVNEKLTSWEYLAFDKGNYYATAEVYYAYDNTNLYIAVSVNSPYHYNPSTTASPGGMYQYECIQVNICSVDPQGDYISKNFDYVSNAQAPTDNVVRQYGYAVNDNNEQLKVIWIGNTSKENSKSFVKRDDAAQKTTYEVAIPWSDLGSTAVPFKLTGTKKVGISISINSSNKEDFDAGKWKNILMRDGGGIIRRNDWSKIPAVTLG